MTVARIAVGIIAATAAFTLSAKERPTDNLTEPEVMSAVLRDNESVKATRAKWEMMKARVPQAKAWEDLRAAGDSEIHRSISIPDNSFMDQTAMLEQEVPISGKNLSRGRAAIAEARAAFEDFRRVGLDVIMRTRVSCMSLNISASPL